ncbi:MAG: STM3941 family protein [Bacteroidota bacterium]
MPEPLIVHPKKQRLYLQVAAMLALLAVSVMVMFGLEQIMHRDLRLLSLILGFLGVVFFGYGLLFNLARLNADTPLLRADAEGVAFYTSPLYRGQLGWDNIREYGLVRHGTRTLVLIFLKEPQGFLRVQKGLQGRLMRNNMKRYETPVVLPAGLFPEDPVEILERLSSFAERT